MKLIFALGNIGAQYEGTRHSVGFALLDTLAPSGQWQTKDKFKAIITEEVIGDQKVLYAKPTTYYNVAGESARAIIDFYKLTLEDVLVVHDDLDLPVGTVRTRIGGSDGGSNGLKSLHAHIGQNFARIRVGVAGEHRTTHDAADYVLGHFTAEEASAVQKLIPTIKDFVTQFIAGEFSHTTNKV